MSRRQQVQECASDFLCQSSECCRKYRFPVVAAMLKNISMFKMTNFWNDNDDDDSSQGLASDDDAEQNDSKKLGKSIIFCLDRAFLTHFSLVSISVLHWKRALCERSVGKKMKSSSFSLAEKALKRNKKKKRRCVSALTPTLSFFLSCHRVTESHYHCRQCVLISLLQFVSIALCPSLIHWLSPAASIA